jgi:hypothetical protein
MLPGTMQKWEYRLENIVRLSEEEANALLQRLGQDGWELIAAAYNESGYLTQLVFKRPALA